MICPRPRWEVVLDVIMGPRTDWFTPQAVQLLIQSALARHAPSNRVGLRLAGDGR